MLEVPSVWVLGPRHKAKGEPMEFAWVLDVTVYSVEFWKVLLGFLWICGVVSMGVTGARYEPWFFAGFGFKREWHKKVLREVATYAWPVVLAIDTSFVALCIAYVTFCLFLYLPLRFWVFRPLRRVLSCLFPMLISPPPLPEFDEMDIG